MHASPRHPPDAALAARGRDHLRHARGLLALGRWLGPWADGAALPPGVERAGAPDSPFVTWRAQAEPRRARRLLLIPGLHFLGPDDPRFSRLASVLTQTGLTVIAPRLSSFLALGLDPNLFREAEAALEHVTAHDDRPVSLMSISFGSIVALHLAATHPERVARVVLFGGYRDLDVAFRYALGGAVAGTPAELRDPLNGPAVLANLAPELLPDPRERAAFCAAALAFSRRTWSRAHHREDKRDGRHLRVGAELAETLHGDARRLFRIACRLEGDPLAVALDAIERARARVAFLDPGPLLPRVRAEVTCIHGRDDDVIPWTESQRLARDLPRARAVITGLYGHTGAAGLPGPRALARELIAMGRALSALSGLAR